MKADISIVKCSNYNPEKVQAAVSKAVELLGGIAKFVPPGSSVLVKPNLLMAKEPEAAIDTHPEVVRAVVRLLKGIGCRIYLGDGPCVFGYQVENVDEVYRLSGMKRVCDEEGIELVKFEERRWRKKFPLTRWLDKCECLVNLPKLKTHDYTLISAAVKNLFGLIPGTYKAELHKNYHKPPDFANILLDIYQEARPCFTLVDGILAMEGDGPGTTGKPRQLGLLLAGRDCVALDSVIAKIIGLEPQDIFTNKEAQRRNLGAAELSSISILGERLQDAAAQPFLMPATSVVSKVPGPVMKLAGKLVRFYPYLEAENCIRCGACVKACPGGAISLEKKGVAFNYAKCISCFCCQEVCPNAAIKVKKSMLAKMIGL